MTEDHELHFPEALMHAAVPPPMAPPTAAPGDAPNDALAVESGDVVKRIEELFPLAWLGMLTVVSVIGIYSAVTKLP